MTIASTFSASFANETEATAGTELPDGPLIRQIATGDQAALRMLVRRYQTRIYRFALRFVGDAGLADDVVSETFFAVWQQAAKFQERSAVGTWLLGIARHKALSSRRRRGATAPLEEAAEVADPAARPDGALESGDLASFLQGCLRKLPVEQAQLIDLVYMREKPLAEVARIVGIPLNTVKSRLFLARKKLAALLAAAGIESAGLTAAVG